MSTQNASLIYEENYSEDKENLFDYKGGFFEREPKWYPPGDKHSEMFNSWVKGGYLYIDVSYTPKNISHWWSERQYCDPNKYYF